MGSQHEGGEELGIRMLQCSCLVGSRGRFFLFLFEPILVLGSTFSGRRLTLDFHLLIFVGLQIIGDVALFG